jgi:hypothetical protein
VRQTHTERRGRGVQGERVSACWWSKQLHTGATLWAGSRKDAEWWGRAHYDAGFVERKVGLGFRVQAHYDARFVERTVGRKRLEFTALAADVRAKLRIEAMQSFAHILQRLSEMFSRCQAHARYFDEPGLNSCTHDTAREPVQQSGQGKRQRVTTPPDDRAG